MIRRIIILSLMLVSLLGLNACDSEPPELMKASKQFESDEIRDRHITYMRKNHMDTLKHKRDETMYQGIRTEKHSINACINCHVPENYKGKVLRHTDQEHFCTTCHTYVAAKLDCFECHVDHPVKTDIATESTIRLKPNDVVFHDAIFPKQQASRESSELKNLKTMDQKALINLAFKYSKNADTSKFPKGGGGVIFNDNQVIQKSNNTSTLSDVNKYEAVSE